MILRTNIYPKSLGDACVTTFVFIIIPVIYYFELFIVLPKFYKEWDFLYFFHIMLGSFILWNVCCNFVAIIICDTSIKGRMLPSTMRPNWRFCSICEAIVPPRSWHCNTCNVCILKRDHHCMFTSCCIGHDNHRYFLMFVFYIFVATLYASCYNVYFIADHISFESWLSVFKMVFPLATIFLAWSTSQVYVFLVIIVFIGCFFTLFLLYFHISLIVQGRVTHERNEANSLYDLGRKFNIVSALGDKWYLVWLSPLIKSELPHNGVDWDPKLSNKAK